MYTCNSSNGFRIRVTPYFMSYYFLIFIIVKNDIKTYSLECRKRHNTLIHDWVHIRIFNFSVSLPPDLQKISEISYWSYIFILDKWIYSNVTSD